MIDNQPIIPCVTSPGPAVYNVRDKAGKNAPKYSFRERIQYKGKAYRLNVPGPGNYGAISMNLKESNRWVKKAQTIPWLEIEKRYAALFTNRKGNFPFYSFGFILLMKCGNIVF